MNLTLFKLGSALVIFAIAVIGGLLPFYFARSQRQILRLGDAFASGVFLSAGLFHLLPDSVEGFAGLHLHTDYPFPYLICTVAFFALLFIERGVLFLEDAQVPHLNADESYTPLPPLHITPYLLVLALSIHSFIEGAALGISQLAATAAVIFLAIIAHKGAASFALAIHLHRHGIAKARCVWMVLLFSLVTPVGVLLATAASDFLQSTTGAFASAIFNAIAAGTFLYIGTIHTIDGPFANARTRLDYLWACIAMLFGITLMAVVAIWI